MAAHIHISGLRQRAGTAGGKPMKITPPDLPAVPCLALLSVSFFVDHFPNNCGCGNRSPVATVVRTRGVITANKRIFITERPLEPPVAFAGKKPRVVYLLQRQPERALSAVAVPWEHFAFRQYLIKSNSAALGYFKKFSPIPMAGGRQFWGVW